jgi:LAO/AO transport system kinase
MHTETLKRFFQGDIRALSRIISLIEDQDYGYQELLGKLYHQTGHSLRIGITGPPGAGKSSLVNCLTGQFLNAGKKVGIIAVDPTSPFTGGALLGDRVRMNEFPADGNVYFRSMATRGAAGGLASATGNVTIVYDAFGFDVTLIETVGVGQMELDVVDACDTVVVVLVPESGDAVQAMKAGLLEIADILCVNKADRPGVERVVAELQQAMDTRKRSGASWEVPVIATEAINNRNIDRMYAKIADFVDCARHSGKFENHRRNQVKKAILNVLRDRFQREALDRLTEKIEFEKIINDVYAGQTNPFTAGDQLFEQFVKTIR